MPQGSDLSHRDYASSPCGSYQSEAQILRSKARRPALCETGRQYRWGTLSPKSVNTSVHTLDRWGLEKMAGDYFLMRATTQVAPQSECQPMTQLFPSRAGRSEKQGLLCVLCDCQSTMWSPRHFPETTVTRQTWAPPLARQQRGKGCVTSEKSGENGGHLDSHSSKKWRTPSLVRILFSLSSILL